MLSKIKCIFLKFCPSFKWLYNRFLNKPIDRPILFDVGDRSDHESKNANECYFDYLNRSARPEVKHARNVIEKWLHCYPKKYRKNLSSRLRSTNDRHFMSAFYELYLYELLKKLGAIQVEIEPSISGTNYKPDFYVKFSDGETFYLEALCLSDADIYEKADIIIEKIAERVNAKAVGLGVILSIQWKGSPVQSDFSSKKMNELVDWCKKFGNEINNNPTKEYQFNTWSIKFNANPSKGNKRKVVAGIIQEEARQVLMDDRLASVLREKGRKYGRLSEKFIIAVNIINGTYEHQIYNGLFGKEAVEFDASNNRPKLVRGGDGFWGLSMDSRYTRVSAIMISQKVTPLDIFRNDESLLVIYHHVNPIYPLTNSNLNVFPHYKRENNRYIKYNGKSAHDIMKMPFCWLP